MLFPHIVGWFPVIVSTLIGSHDPTIAERVLLRECHEEIKEYTVNQGKSRRS